MQVMCGDKIVVVQNIIPFSDEPSEPTVYIVSNDIRRRMYRIKFCPACGKEIKITR